MNFYEHLQLPVFQSDIPRQSKGGGGGYKFPEGRDKRTFSQEALQKAKEIEDSFQEIKSKFSGNINPALIYEVEINQGVHTESFEKILSSMGVHVLSVAENKKGYWVVFNDDENLSRFKEKLETHVSGDGPKYDFFNAIGSLRDIPREEKIGKSLRNRPLSDAAEFIDLELWRMIDQKKNEDFMNELESAYSDRNSFQITDKLITKSFVLLRVKIAKSIFDQIIELKEVARADRPSIPDFNPADYKDFDISDIIINAPNEDATGILVVDSGIISNHPMLEKCVGGEENFQSGETEFTDTVGHGTGVAGCSVYGDIEQCVKEKVFNPSNWVFSAKVMFLKENPITDERFAEYDPEKLIEHQLQDAIDSFIANPEYRIKVVNISLGNSNEVWHTDYKRQLPLAAMLDELAYKYPSVVFVVSAGNQQPLNVFSSIQEIVEGYPKYLIENPKFKILNPATAALPLSIGSIAGPVRSFATTNTEEQLRTPVAQENQPSPFTRTGFGINGMIKPDLVEYGGNTIFHESHGHIREDIGGKIAVLNNQTADNLIKFDLGTSFSSPKVAHLAGQIANQFPQRSANFIMNLLLSGADYPFFPKADFYGSKKGNELKDHLSVCGYGLSTFDRAVNSYDNRALLFDEGSIGINQIKVFSLQLPEIFFSEKGKKRIIVTLTFNPETRLTRGDSYIGNRMEFHLFHSINPQILTEKYGVISEETEQQGVPEELKKFEIDFAPGANLRKAGCHQKAWKEYKREPKNIPSSPISLVLLNFNKWITDANRMQDYCISVTFEHEKEIELYNAIRTTIQTRARVR